MLEITGNKINILHSTFTTTAAIKQFKDMFIKNLCDISILTCAFQSRLLTPIVCLMKIESCGPATELQPSQSSCFFVFLPCSVPGSLQYLRRRFINAHQEWTDNGTQFTASNFFEFCRKNNIKKSSSAPNYPMSHGRAERMVDIFERSLTKMSNGGTMEQLVNKFLRKNPSRVVHWSEIQNYTGYLASKKRKYQT